MRNVVGVAEHGTHRIVVVLLIAFEHRVAEIRQCAQVRIIDRLYDFDQEKGILGFRVVVLEIHQNILCGAMRGDRAQALCGTLHVWLKTSRPLDVHTDTGRPEHHRCVDPLLGVIDTQLPFTRVGIVETGMHAHGNVDDL